MPFEQSCVVKHKEDSTGEAKKDEGLFSTMILQLFRKEGKKDCQVTLANPRVSVKQ